MDALWSRERSTVRENLRLMKKALDYNEATNQPLSYPQLGPMPLRDVTGHSVAIQVVLASREKGRYHDDHQQYESAWFLRRGHEDYSQKAGGGMENLSGSRSKR
jgi:hypothetical protein